MVAANEQTENLERVSARIEGLILAFARDRIAVQRPHFHMVELTNFVGRHQHVAPDSAGRILRNLRKQLRLDYRVLNRRQSLYELTEVA